MALEDFLRRSFALIGRDAPAALAAMSAHLGERLVALSVDGEHARLQRGEPSPVVIAPNVPPGLVTAEATTSRATIAALVSGGSTLEGALIADALELRGALDDVLALHDALLAFARGAARSRRFSTLLDAFLSQDRSDQEAT
jgi:hypothetical protein